ncbi:hypothetical protein F5B20DRAFT_555641 [Whalleya microplaca]|nr:hypothetical protein F5B20DRAFT_555641 [Whalleya microplaca]
MSLFSSLFTRDKVLTDEEEHLRLSGEYDITRTQSSTTNTGNINRVNYCIEGYLFLLHLVLVALVAMFWYQGRQENGCTIPEGASWSPIQSSIQYHISDDHALKHHQSSVYSGYPTAEKERAWDNLLSPMYFAASREELLKAGEYLENGVKLPSGGYLAMIGVYHELHCLKALRLYLYRDKYYHNLTEAQETYLQNHLDHCLETLRITIMCHGNTGMYTFSWESLTPSKPTTMSNSSSVCVKWDSIEEWSLERHTTEQVILPSTWEINGQ